MKKHIRQLRRVWPHTAVALLGIVVLVAGVVTASRQTRAAAPLSITGYAWASTGDSTGLGWMSMGGAGYGVSEDPATGVLSGYAWSPFYGWISFNSSDWGGTCPSGSCQAKVNLATGVVTGWARSCAAFSNKNGCSGALDPGTAGWDGFISLSGTALDGTPYGVKVTSGCWGGFAYGSADIGYISFSGAAADGSTYKVGDPTCGSIPPSVAIVANPTTIALGGSSVVGWTSTNTISCTGTNFSTGGATSGSTGVSPIITTTYTVTCTGNSGGSASASATVTVTSGATVSCSPNPAVANVGDNVTYTAVASGFAGPVRYTWSDANGTPSSQGPSAANTFTTKYSALGPYAATVTASDGASSVNVSCSPVQIGAVGNDCSNTATTNISADPNRLAAPGATTITWNASNVDSACTITGTDGYSKTVAAPSCSALGPSTIPVNVKEQTTYCIVCDGNPATQSCTTVNVGGKVEHF